MELPVLNFPKYNFRFKKDANNTVYVYDNIRKQWLVLTPEEWVRQNWIQHLIHHYHFSPANIILEQGIKLYKTQKRSDIMVRHEQNNYVLIECKRPNVTLNKEILQQVSRYNLVYDCPFIVISNGLQHLFFQTKNNQIIPIEDIIRN